MQSYPAQRSVTNILEAQEGRLSEAVQLIAQERPSTPPSLWHRHGRVYVSLGLLLMFLVALFFQSGLAAGTLRNVSQSLSLLGDMQFTTSDVHTTVHAPAVLNASQQLVRISQLDPNQYSSTAEFDTWAYSACSAASMTEVFNAYGRHVRITDVLKVEARIGMITPSLGLVDPSGIQATAAQFGFKTTWNNSWPLDQIINIANSGKPVIVSFPPDRYPNGHILVLLGGNATTVYLADTSLWNRHTLSRDQFLAWWEGFGAVVRP